MDKPTLRRWGRGQRRGLSTAERDAAGRALARKVLGLAELAVPARVLAYAAVGAEMPTAGLIAALQAAGHRVALPRISDAGAGRMDAVEVEPGANLDHGPHGVPAPPAASPAMPDPAVVLVPGVVFCPDTGARLGQGGGFYDRFLAAHPGAVAIGLAFDAQCSPDAAAVAETHDRMVDALVTESAVRRFTRPG